MEGFAEKEGFRPGMMDICYNKVSTEPSYNVLHLFQV